MAALVAVAGVATLQQTLVATSPLAGLADEGAVVTLRLELTSDVRVVAGQYGDLQVAQARVSRVEGRGRAWELDAPVVLMAAADWPRLPLGTSIETTARLVPGDDDVAALVRPTGEPRVVAEPDVWWDAAAAVRRSVRAAVAGRDVDARELVPALVVGDDGGLDPDLADDFRTTGLTHLLAVSGTNLTLVVGFLLIVARWCGVRGRWLYVAGGRRDRRLRDDRTRRAQRRPRRGDGHGRPRRDGRATVARAAPAGSASRCSGCCSCGRGWRSTAGFALSVLATAGILLLAPVWRDALMRWTPRWVAEAVSVPLAAQVACTPVVAALVGPGQPGRRRRQPAGRAGGRPGHRARTDRRTRRPRLGAAGRSWSRLRRRGPRAWIIAVARRGADVPTAAVDWGTGPVPVRAADPAVRGCVPLAPRLLRQPGVGAGLHGPARWS